MFQLSGPERRPEVPRLLPRECMVNRARTAVSFVLFLLLTGAALLLVPSPASASLDVAGWHFRDLGDLEIPITFDLAFDQDTIAWSASSAEQADIYVVDLAAGASTQLTNTPEIETSVALDGDRVVFVSHEATSDYRDPGDLWLYDLATKERRLVAHARFYLGMGTGPWIVGDHIAWVQIDPADGQTFGRPALYLYTISANATVQVADRVYVGGASSSGNTSIDLDASHLAFITTPSPQEDGEVWLYDIQTGAKTKLGSTPAESLHVSLEGDLVTWVSSPASSSPHMSPYAIPGHLPAPDFDWKDREDRGQGSAGSLPQDRRALRGLGYLRGRARLRNHPEEDQSLR